MRPESPQGTAHLSRREHLFLVMRDACLLEKNQELLFEGSFPMMFLLVKNIGPHRPHQRWTHTQRRISFLPFERDPVLAHPSRRIRFQLLHCFCHSHIRLESQKNVRMVGSSTNRDWHNPEVLGGSFNVGPQLREKFKGNRVATIFGGKDAMKIGRAVCVRHDLLSLSSKDSAHQNSTISMNTVQFGKWGAVACGDSTRMPASPPLTWWAN